MALNTADIHAAADALAAQGKKPTLAAIRTKLGGGSFSTISEAMQSWKTEERKQATTGATPQAVAERAAEMATQVWAIAHELAEQRMKAEREALEQERAEVEQQRREAAELADVLTAELDQARTEIQKQGAMLEELNKAAAVQVAKIESMAERVARAEQQATEARAAETAAREVAAELKGRLEALKATKDTSMKVKSGLTSKQQAPKVA